MPVDAGSIVRKYQLQARSGARDSNNQLLDDWATTRTLRGNPATTSGIAAIRALDDSIGTSPTKYSIRIRFRPTGIDSTMRLLQVLKDGTQVIYDIRDVRHDFDTRQWTYLICEVGGNGG